MQPDIIDIIEAIEDENLLRPFLGDSLKSWDSWMTALSLVYGLPVIGKDQRRLVKECTGRDWDPSLCDGFVTSLFLTGRRSGKSRMAALIGGYEAAVAVHGKKLAKGERGIVAVIAPSKSQARIVKDYVRAIFSPPSILQQEVASETKEGFELNNGTRIEILAGDWRFEDLRSSLPSSTRLASLAMTPKARYAPTPS